VEMINEKIIFVLFVFFLPTLLFGSAQEYYAHGDVIIAYIITSITALCGDYF